jgi:hypothetical protein
MQETEIIFSVQKSREGGYEARAHGYSIFTQADTMDQLKLNVQDAVRCHFDGEPLPAIRFVEARRIFGSAKGEFTVPDDFGDRDPEIEELFYEGPVFPKTDVSRK